MQAATAAAIVPGIPAAVGNTVMVVLRLLPHMLSVCVFPPVTDHALTVQHLKCSSSWSSYLNSRSGMWIKDRLGCTAGSEAAMAVIQARVSRSTQPLQQKQAAGIIKHQHPAAAAAAAAAEVTFCHTILRI